MAVGYAASSPDECRPFGHTKAEYLPAVAEGVLVGLAAGAILRAVFSRFAETVPLSAPPAGVFFLAMAALANGVWGLFLLRRGRALASAALEADGLHLVADTATTLGVMAGLLLAWRRGAVWLDPLFALFVTVHVLWLGLGIVRRSVGGLLDEALAPEVRARVEAAVEGAMAGALEVHHLRTRQAGTRAFVELHRVVPASMTVEEAHAIATRIEGVLPGAWVTVLVEPEGELLHRGRPPKGMREAQGVKPDARIEGRSVTVRGPRPQVERIADRLLSADYPYRVEGSLYGRRYAEVCVRFEATEAASWFAGVAKDELLGPGVRRARSGVALAHLEGSKPVDPFVVGDRGG